MTKREFKKEIKKDESELLAWYSENDLNELKIQFKTLEALLNDGALIYENGDDVYVAPKTHAAYYC